MENMIQKIKNSKMHMKRQLRSCFVFVMLFTLMLCAPKGVDTYATDSYNEGAQESGEMLSSLLRVVDTTGTLDTDEVMELQEIVDECSEEYECDVVMIMMDSYGTGEISQNAADIFDSFGYGQGSDKSGVMLLIGLEEREWGISTRGKGNEVFSDAEQKYIMDRVQKELKNDDFYEAFELFAQLSEEALERHDKWGITHVSKFGSFGAVFLGCLIFGLIIAFIIVQCMKGKLKTVAFQKDADSYMREGSLNITGSREMFLYKNVTKTKIESSSGGSGGGRSGGSRAGRSGSF